MAESIDKHVSSVASAAPFEVVTRTEMEELKKEVRETKPSIEDFKNLILQGLRNNKKCTTPYADLCSSSIYIRSCSYS